jgi:hypothetical protein
MLSVFQSSAPDLTSTVKKIQQFAEGGNANIWLAERRVRMRDGREVKEVRVSGF